MREHSRLRGKLHRDVRILAVVIRLYRVLNSPVLLVESANALIGVVQTQIGCEFCIRLYSIVYVDTCIV